MATQKLTAWQHIDRIEGMVYDALYNDLHSENLFQEGNSQTDSMVDLNRSLSSDGDQSNKRPDITRN